MTIGTFQDTEPPASRLARPGSRVLLAGTARHPDGSPLPDVPAVSASLTDLAAVLRDLIGVRAENLSEPLLDPAGPLALGQAVDRVAAEATDTLLVYYAGHGLIGDDQELYLATGATDSLVHGLDYTALPYRALLRSLRKSRAGTVVVVLDCCFSDRGRPPARQFLTDALFEQAPVHGGFLLTSAARDEFALVAAEGAHTRFTGALIGLLRGGDPAGPRELTLDHVYHFLARELPDGGGPRPHRHSSDRAGELILAPNPAYRGRPAEESADWLPGADGTAGGTPGAGDAPCPFRGLRPFGPEDAQYFFGRDDLVREVTRRAEGGDGLLALIGPSGCGKTSLIRAGAVPRLLERGRQVAVMTPGGDPLASLAAREDALSGSGGLLVVDQFEELFTADVTEDGRRRFLDRLARLPAVIIALRADFYGRCLRYPGLVRALRENQVIVEPMSGDTLRLMIRQSAAAAGLRLEHGLADTLLREAGLRESRNQAAVLPLLSHALQETWLRRSGNLMTLAGYRDTGGIDEAIARTAEKVYGGMDTDGQARMRDLLLRMVRLGDDTEDSRRQLSLAELAPADRQILDALAGARLAAIADETAELAHDAMLHAWPRLREWIAENRAALLAAGQLEDAALAWERAGSRHEYLYRGVRLAATEETLAGAGTTVRPGGRARRFLEASREHQRAEQGAARRRRRRWRAGLSASCVLALAAGTAGVISVRQHAAAVRHAAVIRSSALAADAAALRPVDPGLAAQLSVAAYRASPTEAAATQLYASASMLVDSTVGSAGHPVKVLHVAAQADGPLIAANYAGSRIRVWDITRPSAPVPRATITGDVRAALALAPRRPLLVAQCSSRALCLWNVASRGAPTVIGRIFRSAGPIRHAVITSMAISPDGRLLALATPNDGTLLYTIARPAHPRLLAVLPDRSTSKPSLAAAAFSPDGRLLAETVTSGVTKLWSLADPARPEQIVSLGSGYWDVAFNPAGTLLAAGGETQVRLWNITRPARPSRISFAPATGGSEEVDTVAFTSDGRYLAYSGIRITNGISDRLGLLGLLDVSPASLSLGSPDPTVLNLGFGNSWMTAAAGDSLLTGGYDGTVRLWRAPEPEAASTMAFGSPGWAISGNGRLMAAPAGLDSGFATGIWNISGKNPVLDATLPVEPAAVGFLGNAGKAMLTVDGKGRVTLWNTADPRHPVRAAPLGRMVIGHGPAASADGAIASGTNGTTLVSILGADGRLHLWRIGKGLRVTQAGWIPVRNPGSNLAGMLPDGKHAVIITDKGMQWWDISDPAHPVRIGFSRLAAPDQGSIAESGSLIAEATPPAVSCGCSKLRIFRLSGRQVTESATLPGAAGDHMRISGDGHLLASTGAGDNDLTLWNLRDPRRPGLLAALQTVPAIRGIAFSRNDALLADWNDSTLQLWDLRDLASPTLVASIAFQQQQFGAVTSYGVVFDAAFTPSGRTLAVSVNASVVFLGTDPAAVARRLCSITGAAITHAQWQRYAHGIPYQDPCRSN